MVEIKPMLLSEAYDKAILNDGSKWFQLKENGIRSIIHIRDGKIVGMRNRTNHPILYMFPEFKEITFPFKTGILDAEVCVFRDGKSIYYSGIDHRRSAPTDNTLKENPATLVIFDALKIENNILVMRPYSERYKQINQNIVQGNQIKVSQNYSGKELWDKVIKENQEGLVVKNPNSIYELGKRSKEYLKLKNYKTTEVTVNATDPNDKGSKISGVATIDGKEIDVECQIPNVFDIGIGTIQTIKYLDVVGKKLIQPTVVKRKQMEV